MYLLLKINGLTRHSQAVYKRLQTEKRIYTSTKKRNCAQSKDIHVFLLYSIGRCQKLCKQ